MYFKARNLSEKVSYYLLFVSTIPSAVIDTHQIPIIFSSGKRPDDAMAAGHAFKSPCVVIVKGYRKMFYVLAGL